jgi:hypothetical protein
VLLESDATNSAASFNLFKVYCAFPTNEGPHVHLSNSTAITPVLINQLIISLLLRAQSLLTFTTCFLQRTLRAPQRWLCLAAQQLGDTRGLPAFLLQLGGLLTFSAAAKNHTRP